ncbi:hypothetical protein R0382_003672 [Jeongeupia wiesaeckerbachi]|uniref:DUF6671 family protein n=1 Tax=Jeongeupia wiesaeckerbachi TaxID=3051218 RepID=UPI003D8022D8
MVLPEQVFKGIDNEATLAEAFRVCAAHTADGRVHLETDLRAHMNPTRMASVALVANRLIERLREEGYATAQALPA